jgi:hypothetical protein
MPDLSPEERQRIYLEEKARHEIRHEIEGKKTSFGKVIGISVLCVIALLILLAVIGSSMEESQSAAWQKLSPEQQHQKARDACAEFAKDMQYKLYSEYTQDERKMKASCEAR